MGLRAVWVVHWCGPWGEAVATPEWPPKDPGGPYAGQLELLGGNNRLAFSAFGPWEWGVLLGGGGSGLGGEHILPGRRQATALEAGAWVLWADRGTPGLFGEL